MVPLQLMLAWVAIVKVNYRPMPGYPEQVFTFRLKTRNIATFSKINSIRKKVKLNTKKKGKIWKGIRKEENEGKRKRIFAVQAQRNPVNRACNNHCGAINHVIQGQ